MYDSDKQVLPQAKTLLSMSYLGKYHTVVHKFFPRAAATSVIGLFLIVQEPK
jgi:hypothetical protein